MNAQLPRTLTIYFDFHHPTMNKYRRERKRERKMRGLGEKAVMFCSYISWVVINVLSDWEMNEVFLERTRPINFFSFYMYIFQFMFSNFVPLSHLCCVAGP